jgi:hypothetical protein
MWDSYMTVLANHGTERMVEIARRIWGDKYFVPFVQEHIDHSHY